MTRTFVAGERDGRGRRAARRRPRGARGGPRRRAPGITGRALYDVACRRRRARRPSHAADARRRARRSTRGFYFSLGHGVGLEVHEPPGLGLAGDDTLVAGDVIAIEPGIEGIEGIGGVRFEDLLLITEQGCETLTRYPYDL